MKIHNVNNNAVRFLLHEFMCLRVYSVAICVCVEVQQNMSVRYSLYAVVLTVPLAELKVKVVTELVAFTDLTLTNNT